MAKTPHLLNELSYWILINLIIKWVSYDKIRIICVRRVLYMLDKSIRIWFKHHNI